MVVVVFFFFFHFLTSLPIDRVTATELTDPLLCLIISPGLLSVFFLAVVIVQRACFFCIVDVHDILVLGVVRSTWTGFFFVDAHRMIR